jgi:hypothetical protein
VIRRLAFQLELKREISDIELADVGRLCKEAIELGEIRRIAMTSYRSEQVQLAPG